MLEPLTKRQKEILEFITSYCSEKSYAPTLDEIKNSFKLRSISTVHEHVENLKSKGYLAKSMNQARGIQNISSTEISDSLIELPIIGNIEHNKPITPNSKSETIILHKGFVKSTDNLYAVKVNDNDFTLGSLIKNDLIILSKTLTPENGDMIICTIGSRKIAYLTRYYQEKYRIKLESLRTSIKPRFCKTINLLGVAVGMYRKMI